jgi:hypothetical protein
MKSLVVAVALAAGVSSIARADDSSMSRFTGDSYRAFHENNPVVDKSASSWRQANPNGLPERQYQALSDESQAWQLTSPSFDYSPSSWRQTHPHGLNEQELQAMSNEDPVWQYPLQSEASAVASTDKQATTNSAKNESFVTRVASFFHVPQTN